MKNESQIHDIVISKRLDRWTWRKISELIEEKTGRKFGLSVLRREAHRRGWTKEINQIKATKREVTKDFTKEVGEITTKSLDLQTVEDVLAYADVDTDVWEVDRFLLNSYETPMGAEASGTGKPESYTSYQIKVWLKKIKVDFRESVFIDLINKLKTKKIKSFQYDEPASDGHVLFMGLYDIHFGKLAWHRETGTDWDLKITKRGFIAAVADLLTRAKPYRISKIMFPLGNDFFQIDQFIDGKIGATAKGTPQDTDGRMAKILHTGMEAMVEAVQMCAEVAPIEVVWVPGNHDWNTSYYLANIIDARFHNDDRVTVDISPMPRKYKRYGKVLVGLTHGNEEKHADLPGIMAGEAKKDWAKADDYIWFLGHFHRRKEMRFNAGETYGAVRVLILPSLSGTDAWHHKRGYVNTERAAEAYLFHPEDGYVGHISVKLRKELRGKVD